MTVRISRPDAPRPLPGPELEAAAELLETRANGLLDALGRTQAELSISLVEDEVIAELNHRWRDREEPTDVLSFSLLEGEHAERRGDLLGDVVIGLGVSLRQAGAAGHSLDEELLRLLIHGVLHLLGHDHEKDEEARVMQAEEARLHAELRGREARRPGAGSP